MPEAARKVYDVRDVIRSIVDNEEMLEMSSRWARNMVTAFCRIDGRAVGVIANQPWHLGGVIDADASQKAAKFVRICNSYGIPLVVLVDTPGFLPGTKQEGLGVIRHGAKLLHAFAEAVVPKVTVVLRKAYGGGFITMNSKDLGADLALAWPDAQIGIMGAKQAVGVVHRKAIAAADDPAAEHDRLAAEYEAEHVSAAIAAREGFIDELVEPRDTRRRLAGALSALSSAGELRQRRREHPAVTTYVAMGDSFTAGTEPGRAALAGRARALAGRPLREPRGGRARPASRSRPSSSSGRSSSRRTWSRSCAAPTTCCSTPARTPTPTPSGCRGCSRACGASTPR